MNEGEGAVVQIIEGERAQFAWCCLVGHVHQRAKFRQARREARRGRGFEFEERRKEADDCLGDFAPRECGDSAAAGSEHAFREASDDGQAGVLRHTGGDDAEDIEGEGVEGKDGGGARGRLGALRWHTGQRRETKEPNKPSAVIAQSER